MFRAIREIQRDLKAARTELQQFRRRLGSDIGIEGTSEQVDAMRWEIVSLQEELAEARSPEGRIARAAWLKLTVEQQNALDKHDDECQC